jgi:hypothetical protein
MTTLKTETILETAMSAVGEKSVIVKVVAPTLTAGVQTITLDKLTRISNFIATAEKVENADDYVKSYTIEQGTNPNQIKITVNKMQLSATNTWGAAVTADCATDVIKILAVGQ